MLGPEINIKRSLLCGRNFEYFSEDPYLAGELSAAQIQGVQKHHVGTSLKRFAANNQEYMRLSCSSNLDERTLREIYLTAFEIAVKKAKPYTLMCSYNKINGEYASENEYLLNKILRDEWRFDGFVISDWGAVNDRVKDLKTGLDLEMPASNGCTDAEIVEAVKNGTLDESVLDKTMERILTTIFRFADNREKQTFPLEQHHALATAMEKECAVLLKNENILPLSRTSKIAYIGTFAKHPHFQGGGSSHINCNQFSSALEITGQSCDVSYAKGFESTTDKIDSELFNHAIETAKKAEVAVSVTIKNTGKTAGKAVAQLYVKGTTNTVMRPEKELKGFEKVFWEPNESKTVTMELDARSLSWYCEELGDWYAASGKYQVLVGESSADIRVVGGLSFSTKKEPPFIVTLNTTIGELLSHPKLSDTAKEFVKDFNLANSGENNNDENAPAVSDEAAFEMFVSSPLRSCRSFWGVSTDVLMQKVDEFNTILKNKT